MSTTLVLQTRGLQVKEAEMTPQPKDENDPTQLRRFAKRIAEMKWWNDKSNSDRPEETQDQGEQSGSGQPQATSEDQQPPTGNEQQQLGKNKPSSEGETS
jgi:hypothetical protein